MIVLMSKRSIEEAAAARVALSNTSASVTVEQLAQWLAWSDKAMSITSSVPRFESGSGRYWEEMSPNCRGAWIAFAASLLGVTAKRNVRRGLGLDVVSEGRSGRPS